MKKLFAFLLAVGLVLALGLTVSAAPETGTCGPNVTWSLEYGVLTISGTGYIESYPEFGTNHKTIHTAIIEEGITELGTGLFQSDWGGHDYSALKKVTLPDSLTKIGMLSFYGSGIEEIVIPDHVNFIGHEAFNDCPNLKKVTLGASVSAASFEIRSIAFHRSERPFENCPNLTEIALSPGCSSLVNYQGYIMNTDMTRVLFAPEGLTGAVVLPDTCYTMNDYAFAKSKITSVTFPAGYRLVEDSSFRDCDDLTEVIVPEGVTDVDARAFQNCDNLKTVYLPSTLDWLGMYVFTDTPLEHVTFGGTEEAWDALEKQFEIDKSIMTFLGKGTTPTTPGGTETTDNPANIIVANPEGFFSDMLSTVRRTSILLKLQSGNGSGTIINP